MSVHVINDDNHIQTHYETLPKTVDKKDGAVNKAFIEWTNEQILQTIQTSGNASDQEEGEGGTFTLRNNQSATMAHVEKMSMSNTSAQDFGGITSGEFPDEAPPVEWESNNSNIEQTDSSYGASGSDGTGKVSSNSGNTEQTGSSYGASESNGTGEVSSNRPIFGTSGMGEATSIYGLAATVLLSCMKNKRNIIANRLDQIETANKRVQEITNRVANLKAIGSNLKVDGNKDKHKGDVPLSVFRVVYENNYDANGELDEEDTRTFLAGTLGLDLKKKNDAKTLDALMTVIKDPDADVDASEFQVEIIDGNGNIKNVEVKLKVNHNGLNSLSEKLSAQSEAISTQNQTRNIKLQQQMSELSVTTQMVSAFIDQIKTLGTAIAQRI